MRQRTVPWDRDPHTAAKHAVYGRYLSKWWPIMLRGWGGDVTYAEGFAGPGVYTRGEPGSPVIALGTLLGDKTLGSVVKRARLVFVDADQRCTKLLAERLAAASPPGWDFERLRQRGLDIQVQHGTCEPDLVRLLDRTGAWGRPMLMVLDTWGSGVSAQLLRRVANNPGSEVVVTVGPTYFTRFASVEDAVHGDKVFGGTEWRGVVHVPSDEKSQWLRNQYRMTVKNAGFPFVLDFELVDEGGHVLYLVFGTTHRRGVEKMKEAMWEVDDVRGMGYRDPRDPQQQTLEIALEPHTAPLRRLLKTYLESRPQRQATLTELRTHTLFETVFKESQARQVVIELLDAGELERVDGHRSLALNSVLRLP
jgi:three-Cys-motif partner protein